MFPPNSGRNQEEEQMFNRAQFRVQFKKWQHSNIGDYIEYEILVQALEGQRSSWVVYNRYTDFVKLHEELLPFFRLQISNQSQRQSMRVKARGSIIDKPISKTEQVVPLLPSKITKQTSVELNQRMHELEEYL